MNPATVDKLPVLVTPVEADDDLAARFARGEARALDDLIARYQGRVVGLAGRLLAWHDGAQDVAQDVFLAAWQKHKTFRGEADLWTWLAAITVNRCRTLQRRRWLQQKVLQTIARYPQCSSVDGAQGLVQDETSTVVRAAVADLPAKYREVIVLRYLEELEVTQVADVLGLRRNAVEVRLSRARKQLETRLRHLGEDHRVP